jgi:hypothetical protein
VTENPDAKLDARLFDKVEAELTGKLQRYIRTLTSSVEPMSNMRFLQKKTFLLLFQLYYLS